MTHLARMGVLSAVALCLACGPLVTLPGGRLDGEVAAPPADWSFSNDVEVVQLETNPADPYSVNVWGVAVGEAFYVAAGDPESTWATNIATDPNVRLKIADRVYELRAEAIDSDEEKNAFLAAAKTKYDFEPDEEQRTKSQLYRLLRR